MRELQKKQQTRRILYSIPVLMLATIITLFFIRGAVRIILKERQSMANLIDLEANIASLTIRERELRDEISYLETDQGIKDEIRDRFSVTAEGEHVAVIVDSRTTATTSVQVDKPWYKKLWSAIIGE